MSGEAGEGETPCGSCFTGMGVLSQATRTAISTLGACLSSRWIFRGELDSVQGMSKHFRPWKIDDVQLLPAGVRDYVPEKHLSRFIVALVREHLDLTEIAASYRSVLGQPPFDPAQMTALLLNGYASGIHSSRRIAKACTERVDFMMIVAGDPPDFRTVSEFRRRHLEALRQLFVQVLLLCAGAGLAKLGHVAFDGSKVRANASKHKAMSYGRMEARASELEAEVDQWLAAAAAADAAKDQLYGRDKRGDEMPAWVADKKRRAAKKSVRRRPSWRRRPGQLVRRRRKPRRRPRRSGRPKGARSLVHPQRRPRPSPTRRRRRTSPTRRAGS